ncbi:MAG: hypothetical protein ABL921_05530 [Pirellula sp.]
MSATTSISLVNRGSPNAIEAIDPVMKYGMSSVSKVEITLRVKSLSFTSQISLASGQRFHFGPPIPTIVGAVGEHSQLRRVPHPKTNR